MPKIISLTPRWLTRPSTGAEAFAALPDQQNSHLRQQSLVDEIYLGPHRTLARRGTEVFAVVGNEIRWFNLRKLRHDADSKQNAPASEAAESKKPAYRVLRISIHPQIRQLIVSPSGHFLAILSEHTVHVAILPDSSQLSVADMAPLKLKSWQLGRTTHVLSQSPILAALWHPLANSTTTSDCLVTITAESAVRVWELDQSSSFSFDNPSLAIDMGRLAGGTSCMDVFDPSGFGNSRGFSVDSAEMEAAAACFGGQGREGDDGWASMTLWVAMRNGDVYALCPLLPSSWRPTATQIPSLSTSVISKVACLDDEFLPEEDRQAMQQQLDWVREIDNDAAEEWDVIKRPTVPSAIPRLQGPFLFDDMWDEEDLEVSDIHVAAAKVNAEDLLSGEEEDYADLEGMIQDRLSSTLITLATTNDKIYACLELEGVSGQWLPKTKKDAFAPPLGESRDLVLLDSAQLGSGEAGSHNSPSFSADPASPYDLFLTSANNVCHLSLSAWASRLESELLSPASQEKGLDFRLKVLCGDEILQTQAVVHVPENEMKPNAHLSSSLVINDNDFGYFLLTNSETSPYAATFDAPGAVSRSWVLARSRSNSPAPTPSQFPTEANVSAPELVSHPLRSAYGPSPAFYESPTAPLKQFLSSNVPQRVKTAMTQEIRLSPNTLDLMAEAHRIVSTYTSHLDQAAAELFRRCRRLREELADQVRQMAELSERIQNSFSVDGDSGTDSDDSCGRRLSRAHERQDMLNARYEEIRRKVNQATSIGKPLSDKEKAWVREIATVDVAVGGETAMQVDLPMPDETMESRLETVKELHETLIDEADDAQKASHNIDWPSQSGNSLARSTSSTSTLSRSSPRGIPTKLQRAKIQEAIQMVENEASVIAAVMARLEKLSA